MREIIVHGSDAPALVDDEDYATVSKFKWFAQPSRNRQYFYIMANVNRAKAVEMGLLHPKPNPHATRPQRTRILLHRLVMQAKPGEIIDHKDGDTLDCRKSQLRRTDFAGNSQNRRKKYAPSTSKYKGVHPFRRSKKAQWEARIRNRYIGRFNTEEEAALAYDGKATELYGEFARLNFY